MEKTFVTFIFLCLWNLTGVFGVEVKSVTEGESVTLKPDLTGVQRDDEIQWRFNNILIAQINTKDVNKSTLYDGSAGGRFRDRLKVDQTGSLTIINTRTTDSGEYKAFNIRTDKLLHTFSLAVYAHLPVPVINRVLPPSSSSELSSVSTCVFLCSVENVHHVTLSWFRGNSSFSNISVSDLSRNITLDLECLDDSYSCVVNNPISNQTTHINSTEVCQPCPERIHCCGETEAAIRLAFSALVGVAIVAVLVYEFRSRNLQQKRNE